MQHVDKGVLLADAEDMLRITNDTRQLGLVVRAVHHSASMAVVLGAGI